MRGQSEVTETFLTFIQIALVIIGALAIYFTNINYTIIVHANDLNREANVLGNALMSSDCLTNGEKGLLVQSKIDNFAASCFGYTSGIVEITAGNYVRVLTLGPAALQGEAELDVLVQMDSLKNQIVPGKMKVRL
jgi:hypothetical protein